MNKKIIYLNASAMKVSSCDRRLFWTILDGYRNEKDSNDICYGSAFHLFVSNFTVTKDLVGSMELARDYYEKVPKYVKYKKEWMTSLHLQKTMMQYHMIKQVENSTSSYEVLKNPFTGAAAVELKFSVPLYEDEVMAVVLCGTIDQVVRLSGGMVCVADFKTTSSWNHKEYLENYQLSAQLQTYVYGLNWYAKMFPAFKEMIGSVPIGAFIEGVFLSSQADTVFERGSIMRYSLESMELYEKMLMKLVDHIVLLTKQQLVGVKPDPNGILNDSCQTKYGKCPFFHVCASPDEQSMMATLKSQFIQQPYNPTYNPTNDYH